jgi:hypothetical protein
VKGHDLLQILGTFCINITIIQRQTLQGRIHSQTECHLLQSLSTKLVKAQVELQQGYIFCWGESLTNVIATYFANLVNFQFKLFECFSCLHVLADVPHTLIIGLKIWHY